MKSYLLEEFKKSWHYKHRDLNSSKYPSLLGIEITNFCNFRCNICPYKIMTRPKQHMEFSLFRKIIDEIKDYPDFFCWLHWMGEPLLHPKIIDFIKCTKNAGLKCGFSTNASLLTKDIGKKLIEVEMDKIVLCLDGNSKESYEKVRNGGNFEVVKENIKNFLEMKGNLKPQASLQFVKNKYNTHEIEDYKKEWIGKGADMIDIKTFVEWGNQVKGISSEIKNRNKRFPCKYLWNNIGIYSDGNVGICCFDYDASIRIGNVNEKSILEIWNGNKLKELRKQQINGNFNNGLCDNCREWKGSEKNIFYPFDLTLFNEINMAIKLKLWQHFNNIRLGAKADI